MFNKLSVVFWCVALAFIGGAISLSCKADIVQKPVIYVNNKIGDDTFDGLTATRGNTVKSGPLASIMEAVRKAPVGACISIANTGDDYRETLKIESFNKGRAANPLVIDGHGATVNGLVAIPTQSWIPIKDDIYAFDGLMPNGKRMVMPNSNWLSHLKHQGWFDEAPQVPQIFFINGKLAPHTKELANIAPGGFFYDSQVVPRCLYFRLPQNGKLADQRVEIPLNEGVYVSDDYVVVRNLRSIYSQDDGFYGFWGIGVVLENIYSGYNCDQGISFHGTASTTVDNALIEYNAGCGIADVMSCSGIYRNIVVRNNFPTGGLFQGLAFTLLNCRFENNCGLQVKSEYATSLNMVNCLVDGNGQFDGIELVGGKLYRCTVVNCQTGIRTFKPMNINSSIIAQCQKTPLEFISEPALKESSFNRLILSLGNEAWDAGMKRIFGATADRYLQNPNDTSLINANPVLKAPLYALPNDSPLFKAGDLGTTPGATLPEYTGWKVIEY